jgi:hypothetical protein
MNYVETAAPLRRLLSKVQVEEIKLVDEQVFQGFVTYPTITTLVNRQPSKTSVIQLRDGTERRCTLNGNGASWMPLIRGASEQKKDRATLKDLCVRISCGVATGADDIFVRKAKGLQAELVRFARPTIAGDNRETGWWREVDSNCRYRFLNWQTTAFRRRLQHSDESRSAFRKVARPGSQVCGGRRRDDGIWTRNPRRGQPVKHSG